VLLFVALSGVYLVLTVMRLFQVGRRGAGRVARSVDRSAAAFRDELVDLSRNAPPLQAITPAAEEPAATYERPRSPPVAHDSQPADGDGAASMFGGWRRRQAPPPVVGAAGGFVEELARSNLEVEVQQLRRQSAGLRDELSQMHKELALLKAARNVSPLYNEAVAMAQRGATADGIAGQCGISLGEAELVAALARASERQSSADEFEIDEDGNGGHSGPGRRTGTHG
jgi:hypothetical protein